MSLGNSLAELQKMQVCLEMWGASQEPLLSPPGAFLIDVWGINSN